MAFIDKVWRDLFLNECKVGGMSKWSYVGFEERVFNVCIYSLWIFIWVGSWAGEKGGSGGGGGGGHMIF